MSTLDAGATLRKLRASAVHAYTASGGLFAFLAAGELCTPTPDPRVVLVMLLVAVFVDATDGPLARLWDVKTWAGQIDGRTIDDIVDYLTFTFIPLLLVWRMKWVPEPAALWIAPALILSLLGFANISAKNESRGYFLGFPSYWNIYAYYAGILATFTGTLLNGIILLILAALTVMPVRFLYPNLTPAPWRLTILIGAGVWAVMLAAMVPTYPTVNPWLAILSLLYPVFYTGLSYRLLRA
jgi:phosphatidylcholine synthase